MEQSGNAGGHEAYVVEQRRWFHRHPELGEKEFESAGHIRAELDRMGIEWRSCGMETGTLAAIQGTRPGRTILLRADMDALEVTEETGLDFASENRGLMHACGHDCHMAMLLAAAGMLQERREELCGTVRLAFQPAEETGDGAAAMLADGAMDGVEGCFAIHVWADVPSGRVSVEAGPRMAAVDWFRIKLAGKGCHGAQPHQGADAAVASCALVGALQSVVSREIDPLQPAVVTVGKVRAGSQWNVVPEWGRIEGTARCFDPEVREQLEAGVRRMAEAVGAAYRVETETLWQSSVPPVINDGGMSALAEAAARKAIGSDAPYLYGRTNAGEDFARFLERAPGALALLGVGGEDTAWPQHSGKFQVDECALIGGARLYAQVALDFNAG